MAARINDGGHVHVFVSLELKVCIPETVRVLKCNYAEVLFEECLMINGDFEVNVCGRKDMLFAR